MGRVMAKKKPPGDGEYEIGRGKPPIHSQFQPGRSGNPGGRKKGNLNYKTVVKAVMESEIEVTGKNGSRPAPLVEAILLAQAQDALRGNSRAIDSLLDRYERCADEPDHVPEELAEDDEEMLEEILKRRRRRASPGHGSEDPS
jgi:hypothetical protein